MILVDLGHYEREHCLRLLREGGPGWAPYVLRKAEAREKEDPELFAGIVAAVEAELGPVPTIHARAAAVWMER